jgi:hypothetical protein
MNCKRTMCCAVLFSIGSLLSACAMGGIELEGAGSAEVTVQALSSGDIAEVRVTVSGPCTAGRIGNTLDRAHG